MTWKAIFVLAAVPSLAWGEPARIGEILARLPEASESDARALTSELYELWADGPSDAADFLYERVASALRADDWEAAETLATALTDVAPDFPEAFRMRAAARRAQDDFAGAVADLARTLELDPKRFRALATLGRIFHEFGDIANAHQALKQALALNPHMEEAAELERLLRVDAEGRPI